MGRLCDFHKGRPRSLTGSAHGGGRWAVQPLPNGVRYDCSGDGIEAALEGCLERLQTTHIEIVYVHDIGEFTRGTANAGYMEDLPGSGLARLIRQKEQGRIGAVGLGVNENEICLGIMDHARLDAILLAGRLTLLDRSAEIALTAKCRSQGTSLVLGGVFNSGIPATGPRGGDVQLHAGLARDPRRCKEPSKPFRRDRGRAAHGSSAFCPAPSSSVLIGTAKASTLEGNLAALAEPMPPAFDAAFQA